MTPINFTRREFIDAGCMQFESLAMGNLLYFAVNGQICNEFPKLHNCSALRALQSIHRNHGRIHPHSNGGETIREEAVRRNIGIKEVRRQRNTASRGE